MGRAISGGAGVFVWGIEINTERTQREIVARKETMSRWLRNPIRIVVIACLLRIGVVGAFFTHNKFSWGLNELAEIARALVEGRGFSSAFHGASGATAWFAPAYPALLALIFRIFGVETQASAIVVVLLNVIFASLTAWVLIELGRKQFNETAGVVAGWAWAVAPPLLFMPWLPWETCLSGLAFAFSLMTTLALSASSSAPLWAWCGATWGITALINPAILASFPAMALCIVVRTRHWKGAFIMTAVCMLCILPWTVRNYLMFKHIVPVRSNLWPELYFGNVDFSLHPLGSSMLYQREGESLFVEDMKGRALNFVRSNPGAFYRRTEQRVVAFWAQPSQLWPYPWLLFLMTCGGVVESMRRGKRWPEFLSVLLFYPLTYFVTHAFARFRYPIEPLMYALAAYFICELVACGQRWRAQSGTKPSGMEKPRYKAPGVAMRGRR